LVSRRQRFERGTGFIPLISKKICFGRTQIGHARPQFLAGSQRVSKGLTDVFTRKPDQKSPPADVAAPRASGTPWPVATQPAVLDLPAQEVMPSVIGNDLSIEGQSITIRCKGALQVNGNIQADLHSRRLVVGPDAVIMGSIAATEVEVFGCVHGAIYGTHVRLQTSAKVDGDIHSEHLQIESGASFDGRSRKVLDGREIAPKLESEAVPGQAVALPPATGAGAAYPGIVTPGRDRLHS
jgi:cytoskeletal protein CcmA (bactofilin family)